jgi:hypothetical protein
VAAFSHVGCTTASIAVGIEPVAPVATTVKTTAGSRIVATNVYFQLLSRCDWDDGVYAPAVAFAWTAAASAKRNNLELPDARRYLETLRSARVIKRFVVRKRVRRSVIRHDAVIGATAASREHCNGHATAERVTTEP